MNCDEEAVRIEAMHLDRPVLSGAGTVDDDEDEVVVAVDFGSLIELFRVLDGARMKFEHVAENREGAVSRVVKIKPEEVSGCEQALDRLAVELDQRAPSIV